MFRADSDSITWAASFTAGKNLISFGHKAAFTRCFEKPLNDHYLFKIETKARMYQIATSADNLREHIYIENLEIYAKLSKLQLFCSKKLHKMKQKIE